MANHNQNTGREQDYIVLTANFRIQTLSEPESSFGAHTVRVFLKTGEILEPRTIVEGTWLSLIQTDPRYESDDILKLEFI